MEPYDQNQFAPSAQVDSSVPPMAPIRAPKQSKRFILVICILFCIVTVGVLWLFLMRTSTKETIPVIVTETPSISPTPVRAPSALATQSAFLHLEEKIASLSAGIQQYVTVDPSLSPPTFDLPLGFQR